MEWTEKDFLEAGSLAEDGDSIDVTPLTSLKYNENNSIVGLRDILVEMRDDTQRRIELFDQMDSESDSNTLKVTIVIDTLLTAMKMYELNFTQFKEWLTAAREIDRKQG